MIAHVWSSRKHKRKDFSMEPLAEDEEERERSFID